MAVEEFMKECKVFMASSLVLSCFCWKMVGIYFFTKCCSSSKEHSFINFQSSKTKSKCSCFCVVNYVFDQLNVRTYYLVSLQKLSVSGREQNEVSSKFDLTGVV